MKKIHLIIALLVVIPFTVSAAKVKKPTYAQLVKQVRLLQSENKALKDKLESLQIESDKTKRELNFCRANPTTQRVIEERVVSNIAPVVQNKVPSRMVNLFMVPVAKVEIDNIRQVTGFRLQFSPVQSNDTLTVETDALLESTSSDGDVRFYYYTLNNENKTFKIKITLNDIVYNATLTSTTAQDPSNSFSMTLLLDSPELFVY